MAFTFKKVIDGVSVGDILVGAYVSSSLGLTQPASDWKLPIRSRRCQDGS